jgi:hypothetical protein
MSISNETGLDNSTIEETSLQEIVKVAVDGPKNVVLDATVFATLMSCPRKGDFQFNHNLRSIKGKSNSLECGSIVHAFMEYYYKAIILGTSKDQAFQYGMTAAELYIKGCQDCSNFVPTPEQPKPSCGHKVGDFPGVTNTPVENETKPYPRTGWQWVLDTCGEYYKFYRNDHWVPLEIEVVKSKVIYEDEDVRILWKSKLDMISDTNQGIYPVDHKTMKQNRKDTKLIAQFLGQCLVMETRNAIKNIVGFQTTLEPKDRFLRPLLSYDIELLDEFQYEIVPFYAKMLLVYADTGYFPPNYTACNGKYGACAFLDVCEGNPSDRERRLQSQFIVGPEWNPTNADEDGD